MNRQVKENYIPLNSSALGDNHKLVRILTAGQGVLRAAVFGVNGKRGGAQRALIQPFSHCRGEFYYDPVKKLWRLKEGECLEVRESFHSHLNKYYAALFWADLITGSHGGGGSTEFYGLTLELLRALDREDGERTGEVFLLYLWYSLELEGIRPDLDACSRCGRRAPAEKALCYAADGQIVCARCRVGELPVLSAEARGFLGSRGEGALSLEGRRNLSSYLISVLRLHFRMKMDRSALDIILN